MPESKELWEEGLNVTSMKIVSGGVFLEDDVRAAFDRAGSHPGCSATRRIQDNLSDLKAQTSSNQRGITLLGRLCEEFGLSTVHKYMRGIQANAEVAVRSFFKSLAQGYPEGRVLKARTSGTTGRRCASRSRSAPRRGPLSTTSRAAAYTVSNYTDGSFSLSSPCG